MSNTIIELRHSYVTGNVPSSLANGEIAINTYDGKLFYRGGVSNTIQTIERFQGPAGLNQEIQFNDSGVLGADSGLTYNKTTDVLTVVGGAIVGGVNVTPQIQFAFTQANSAFIAANSAGVYANSAFAAANAATATDLTQNNSITAAFAAANAATATDTTQNNSITAAFAAANAATATNTTQNNSITAAFAAANAATATDTTQNNSIAAAFTRANNALNANTGGTVTGDLTIGTGAGGVIAGANVIYSNVFVANSNGYIQFSDGSKQFTANAGSGTANSSDYFPIGDYGNLTDPSTSAFGELLIVVYDCRIDPITPNGFFLTKDFGLLT
jgi:hypothetical protein